MSLFFAPCMPTHTFFVLVILSYLPLLFTFACPPFLSFLTLLCLPYPPIPFSLATCPSFCLPSHRFLSLHTLPSLLSFFMPYLALLYWCLPHPTFPSFSTMPSFLFFWLAMFIFPSFLVLPCCSLPYPALLTCHAFFLCLPFHLLPFYFCLPCPTLPCPIRSPLPYPPLSHPIPILPYPGLLFITSMELLVKKCIQNFGKTIDQRNHTTIFFFFCTRVFNANLTHLVLDHPLLPHWRLSKGGITNCWPIPNTSTFWFFV
jgi:hypothetical protein